MRNTPLKYIAQRFLPFALSAALLIILVNYAPWAQVGHILARLSTGSIILLIGLSLLYYALKAVRFWYLLIAIGIRQPFWIVALSYISAQPASLLPGGEIFRSHALQKMTGVPIKQSLPQFIMQGVLEGAGLATVMVVSALALNELRIPAIVLSLLVISSLIALSRGYLSNFLNVINRLPFLHIKPTSIERFSTQHRQVLTWRWLPLFYVMSVLTEVIGSLIAYASVRAIGGHINLFEAGLMYTIPIIIGFISLLPGGFGASEQSSVGVLVLARFSTAQAVAATLITRFTIVILGVTYGAIAILYDRVILAKTSVNK